MTDKEKFERLESAVRFYRDLYINKKHEACKSYNENVNHSGSYNKGLYDAYSDIVDTLKILCKSID